MFNVKSNFSVFSFLNDKSNGMIVCNYNDRFLKSIKMNRIFLSVKFIRKLTNDIFKSLNILHSEEFCFDDKFTIDNIVYEVCIFAMRIIA